jgi:hypothetical protein
VLRPHLGRILRGRRSALQLAGAISGGAQYDRSGA